MAPKFFSGRIFVRGGGAMGIARCGRGQRFPSEVSFPFQLITSGRGFSCRIQGNNTTISVGALPAPPFRYRWSLECFHGEVARENHVCGFRINKSVICNGRSGSGQRNIPLKRCFSTLLAFATVGLEFVVVGKRKSTAQFNPPLLGSRLETRMVLPLQCQLLTDLIVIFYVLAVDFATSAEQRSGTSSMHADRAEEFNWRSWPRPWPISPRITDAQIPQRCRSVAT